MSKLPQRTLSNIHIHNFKSLKDVSIDMKPITILCGANSCGKSSIIKSILFAKQVFEECAHTSDPIPFNGSYTHLGSFETCVTRGEKDISLSYSFPVEDIFSDVYSESKVFRKYKDIEFEFLLGNHGNTFLGLFLSINPQNNKEHALSYHICYIQKDVWEIARSSVGYESQNQAGDFHIFAKTLLKMEKKKQNSFHSGETGFPAGIFDEAIPVKVSTSGMIINDIQGLKNDISLAKVYSSQDLFSKAEYENYLEVVESNRILINLIYQQINELFSCINYLGPLRAEPNRRYVYDDIIRTVGINGENAAGIFRNYATKKVKSRYRYNTETGEVSFDKKTKTQTLENKVNDCFKALSIPLISYEDGELVVGEDNIADVGFGVSQIFPLIIESVFMSPGDLLITEQPELHLHPAMQMKLADILLGEALSGKRFLIETHSEHIINRLVRRIVEDGIENNSLNIKELINIVFLEPENGHAKITNVEIDPNAGIINWPKGFFDQEIDETRKLVKAALQKREKSREAKS